MFCRLTFPKIVVQWLIILLKIFVIRSLFYWQEHLALNLNNYSIESGKCSHSVPHTKALDVRNMTHQISRFFFSMKLMRYPEQSEVGTGTNLISLGNFGLSMSFLMVSSLFLLRRNSLLASDGKLIK